MRIAFTISDAADAVHTGGEVPRITYIVLLDALQVPTAVLEHLARVEQAMKEKKFCYESMSISIVKDW